MVKGLTGTMLRLAKSNQGAEALKNIFEKNDPSSADFSVPSVGLFLTSVEFNDTYFLPSEK
jgi:tRNA pseudouridine38-40 synthase